MNTERATAVAVVDLSKTPLAELKGLTSMSLSESLARLLNEVEKDDDAAARFNSAV